MCWTSPHPWFHPEVHQEFLHTYSTPEAVSQKATFGTKSTLNSYIHQQFPLIAIT
jgi:hypothetical protein